MNTVPMIKQAEPEQKTFGKRWKQNPTTGAWSMWDKRQEFLIGYTEEDPFTQLEVTMLLDPESGTVRNLVGNWTKEYEEIIDQGLGAAVSFYETHRPQHDHLMSTDNEEMAKVTKQVQDLMQKVITEHKRAKGKLPPE